MNAIVNRYPGACQCGAKVPVNAGVVVKVRGTWVTFCAAHNPAAGLPAVEEKPASVVLSADTSGAIKVETEGKLGNAFGLFLEAKKAARARNVKVGGEWVSYLHPSEVAGFAAALRAAGVHVEDRGGAAETVKVAAAKQETENAAGEARLVAADAALAPLGRSLRPYQRDGIRWLVSRGNRGALLADDMGLGKTAQALISLPQGAKVVVVGPSVAKGVWARELGKWRPDLGPARVVSGRQKDMPWPTQAGEVVIINYDILPPAAAMGEAPEGVFVILDEAHAVKNSKAKRTLAAKALGEAARARGGCVWTLTATPLTNQPPELWSVLQVAGVASEAFGSFKAFKERFGAVEGRFGLVWGFADSEVKGCMRRVMLRRTKLDVANDLPAKSREVREVPLEKDGEKLINDVVRRMLKEGQDIDDILANLEKGIAFEAISAIRAACALAKLPAVEAIVEEYEESGEPLIVFSAHRAVIDTIAAREGWGRITGDETPEQKTAVEEAFQAGKLRGVAATIKAGGVAITLTRACNAVFVDQAWTPADNVQAEDRIFRIGQTRPVTITVLQAAHPIDERVTDLLLTKTRLYEGAINAARYKDGEAPQAATIATVDLAAYSAPRPPVSFDDLVLPPREPRKPSKRLFWRGETCAEADDGAERGPESPAEVWASGALLLLAGDDDDRAMIQNGVGFNKADGGYGHAMARQLEGYGGLTPRGWAAAVELTKKYWRQVGSKCP